MLRDRLAKHFETIVLDNRGVGLSSVPEGPYSMRQLADDAVGLLDALDVPRAHVLGVSMGGYVAQTIALDHPARVMGLVLGCTYMSGDPSRLKMPASALEILMKREGTPEKIARRGLRLAFSDRYPDASPEVFETLVRWRMERTPTLEGYRAQLAACMAFDVTDRVGAIGHDTLVLHGDEDVVVPVERGEELASAIPGARLRVLRGAGHLFFIEQVELTAGLVRAHMEGRP